jgi:hypothetical protein
LRSQQLWPPVQSSGEVWQPATTQTFDWSVSQWLASKPWQSMSDAHGVPKPVGPAWQAERVSPVVQGTQADPSGGASGAQRQESDCGSKIWLAPQRALAS